MHSNDLLHSSTPSLPAAMGLTRGGPAQIPYSSNAHPLSSSSGTKILLILQCHDIFTLIICHGTKKNNLSRNVKAMSCLRHVTFLNTKICMTYVSGHMDASGFIKLEQCDFNTTAFIFNFQTLKPLWLIISLISLSKAMLYCLNWVCLQEILNAN